jgi:hypothetical protein
MARELIECGWSVKSLQRQMVTSATYRQSSKSSDSAKMVDSDARLLWRFPPRRLEAESLRDAILLVAGNLDLRMGGPGFDLFEPNTNYVKVYNSKSEFDAATFRRMVYQSKPRMQLDDTFGAFDCPDAGQIAPRRNRSITPLQSLNLLNSPFSLQQSAAWSERLQRDAGTELSSQIRLAFISALGREPSAEEQADSRSFIAEHGMAAFCRALLSANEFVFVF